MERSVFINKKIFYDLPFQDLIFHTCTFSASNALQGCTQAVHSADLSMLTDFVLSKLLSHRGI